MRRIVSSGEMPATQGSQPIYSTAPWLRSHKLWLPRYWTVELDLSLWRIGGRRWRVGRANDLSSMDTPLGKAGFFIEAPWLVFAVFKRTPWAKRRRSSPLNQEQAS